MYAELSTSARIAHFVRSIDGAVMLFLRTEDGGQRRACISPHDWARIVDAMETRRYPLGLTWRGIERAVVYLVGFVAACSRGG